jgi:hypothetical protein
MVAAALFSAFMDTSVLATAKTTVPSATGHVLGNPKMILQRHAVNHHRVEKATSLMVL